jgi:DNA-binding transcriptional ArsR family regulator
MSKQSFLLVSLKENKAKELAQVISNDSCRKILDFLGEKEDATETELAQKLNIPISTVHYNLKHLIKAGIITVDEFHYSEKGKEVNHYKLANKYIIIAPKTTYGIKEKLKSVLPVALLALIGTSFIHFYTKYFKPAAFGMKAAAPVMKDVIREAEPAIMEEAKVPVAEKIMETAAEGATSAASQAVEKAEEEVTKAVIEKAPEVVTEIAQAPNYALWFLLGCVFVIILIIIFELIKAKRENK